MILYLLMVKSFSWVTLMVILGNSLGNKGRREPNQRGLKLLNLANYFNLCPVNLMNMCAGPLETFNSFCWRYHTTLDYIFVP